MQKMNLSTTIDNFNKNKTDENNLTESLLNSLKMQDQFDILDLSELDLDNSETWLYEISTPNKSSKIIKQQQISSYSGDQIELNDIKLKSIKSIDTRTFTRPKKKLINRLSINDIEQMYQNGNNDGIMNSSCEGIPSLRTKVPQSVIQEELIEPNKFQQPVQFDLTQPTSLHNFDSFTMMSYNNTIDRSYLQDMSPPSLVNSLCSSTFANLMESSLIKNDPILSEIRDKDYTESVLLQDIEAPLYQSITESFSSINSDTPENFLKKVTRDNNTTTFRRNTTVIDNSTLKKISDNFDATKKISNNNGTVIVNSTYEIANYSSGDSQSDRQNSSTDDGSLNVTQKPIISNISNHSIENFNGTYRRTPKQQNGTFIKSEDKNHPIEPIMNTTYGRKNSIPNDLTYNTNNKDSSEESLSCTRSNSTGKTAILRGNSLENLKKRFSSDGSINSDPLSYSQHEEEERKDKFNSTCPGALLVDDLAAEIKSFRSSLGSADSLDRMSSLSSSSKGSNKVLSMEDVQAIVEMQERSLNRAISTPKVLLENRQFWENSYISPIVNDTKNHSSDSEILEERKSTKPHQLIKRDTFIRKLPSKQLGPLANKELKFKSNKKLISDTTIVRPKPLKAFPADVRGSYTNIAALKDATFNIGGSQQNLSKLSPPITITTTNHASSANSTNLNSMGIKLKSSYTSLKPLSANLLPVVSSAVGNNLTKIRPNSGAIGKSESPPVGKIQAAEAATANNRASCLPRPTGIPRPFSRIPGPRTGIAKSSSARGVNNY